MDVRLFALVRLCFFPGAALSLVSSDPWVEKSWLASGNTSGWDEPVSVGQYGVDYVALFVSVGEVGSPVGGCALGFVDRVEILQRDVEEDDADQMPHLDDFALVARSARRGSSPPPSPS